MRTQLQRYLWKWIFVQGQGNVVETVLEVQASRVNAATKGRDWLQIADFQVQDKGTYTAYVTTDDTRRKDTRCAQICLLALAKRHPHRRRFVLFVAAKPNKQKG